MDKKLSAKEQEELRDSIEGCAKLWVLAAQAAGYSPMVGAAACAHLRESFLRGNDHCADVVRAYERAIARGNEAQAAGKTIVDDALKQEDLEEWTTK